MKKLSLTVVAIVLMGVGAAVRAGAPPLNGQVYEVSMNGGIVQSHQEEVGETVEKGSFTTANIINLARGRSTGAVVPANEKLALVFVFVNDGNPLVQLVVFDTNAQSNLTVISQLDLGGAVDSVKGKGIIAMAGGINETGNFGGGWVAVTGKVGLNTTNPDAQIASFSGAIQGVFRGFDDGEFEVIVTKGKASVVGKVGDVFVPIN